MKHALFATAVLVLLLAGCNRPADTAVDAAQSANDAASEAPVAGAVPLPVDQAVDLAAGTDTNDVVDHGTGAIDDGTFDAKAFAGTFATDGTSLAIRADGTYTLTVHAESAGADLASDGTWTVRAGGHELLLDPTDKSDSDRVFRIATNDIQTVQLGFIGIAVALLGRNTASGTVAAALLFGALLSGTSQRNLDPTIFEPSLAANLTFIIQGLVILIVSADVIVLGLVARSRGLFRRRRASPAVSGEAEP